MAVAGFVIVAMPAPGARGDGAPEFTVRAHSTASDNDVSGIVEALAAPGTRCSGTVRTGRYSRRLPANVVGRLGGIYWQWRINGAVPATRWVATIACRGVGWSGRKSASFPAAAGIGPGHANQLFVPSSLTHGELNGGTQGVGGGGGSLYPRGQCTWWVSLQRPDLPWFPGSEGNAMNWAVAARKRGLPTGTSPAVGAVAVFAPGQYGAGRYGHVAYVLALEGADNEIIISEYDFSLPFAFDTRRIPSLGLTFIYRKEPESPSTPSAQTPEAGKTVTEAGTVNAPSPQQSTLAETTGGEVRTWADYQDAGGSEGPTLAAYQTVQVACKVEGFAVADGNVWWYRLASTPWENLYYASADAFYNNGQTSGSLQGTPFVDPNVPTC